MSSTSAKIFTAQVVCVQACGDDDDSGGLHTMAFSHVINTKIYSNV